MMITAADYDDLYPVTMAGKITAMFIMFMGIGIIAVLANFLSNILVGSSHPEEEKQPANILTSSNVDERLANIEKELSEIRYPLNKKKPRADGVVDWTTGKP